MRVLFLGLVASCALALVGAGRAAGAAPPTTAADGQVVIIQAVPGLVVDVSVDDRTVRRATRAGDVLGPYRLASGHHEVRFAPSSGAAPVIGGLTVRGGSSSDVVLHSPADPDGDPVVSSYRTPLSPIGPGKARLLIAHTATVPPADVRFDGRTVFRDIANGEFAQADVPRGGHEVALVPTALPDDGPLLGPVHVTLRARTVTMAYAFGRPEDRSMGMTTHALELTPNGALVPRTVATGSAGLAAGVRSLPFSAPRPGAPPAPRTWLPTLFLRLLHCGVGTPQH